MTSLYLVVVQCFWCACFPSYLQSWNLPFCLLLAAVLELEPSILHETLYCNMLELELSIHLACYEYLQHFRAGTFHFACYLQHFGDEILHLACYLQAVVGCWLLSFRCGLVYLEEHTNNC